MKPPCKNRNDRIVRIRITIRGVVQGVGFRPLVYRLAKELSLNGWIANTVQGIVVEAEGNRDILDIFLDQINCEKPENSSIQSAESRFLDPIGFTDFRIKESSQIGKKVAAILPDIATCDKCLNEFFDPNDRRYLYPFINCTHCGPRFTIVEKLPYDRSNTSMQHFQMCEQCHAEYENPDDRRFHAQPNACDVCGPHVELWNRAGDVLHRNYQALFQAISAIRDGLIVATKGVGGFQLIADARNDEAVKKLRRRKHRMKKPFALMIPSLDQVQAVCMVSKVEAGLLRSPASPIVILERLRTDQNNVSETSIPHISSLVAPGNPTLGIMLPYSPLHHLLMKELGFPIIATSGNVSDETICINEYDALDRLSHIADVFLVHDRPIIHHVDDSVVRILAERALVLRRARGYAPLPIFIDKKLPSAISVGAHLKNTISATVGKGVVVSQHVGDLETSQAYSSFKHMVHDVQELYHLSPEIIVCDQHPDYLSSQFADRSPHRIIKVQHHYAHILSCMAENDILESTAMGVAWDGTGYGDDGTIWGGEFFKISESDYTRCACLRPFPLPGGDRAVEEPTRSALGLLYEYFGEEVFEISTVFTPTKAYSNSELEILKSMLQKNINTPKTSSVGRLFDAIASITGLLSQVEFEGQAAMEFEFAMAGFTTNETYLFNINNRQNSAESCRLLHIDIEVMLKEILLDIYQKIPISIISTKFHNTLVEIIVAIAKKNNGNKVVLSGGCFQNKYLTERTITRLLEEGFQPYWHKHVPPNDGGISLGQIVAAGRILNTF